MDYQQTIEYLFTRLPMFSRIGASAIKKDVTNTIELCEAVGNPHKKFKSVHIAGTNGKGSVSHMLAAVLQTAGYKTGLYTSPHLKDFRERIRIDGDMISQEYVVDFVKKIQPKIVELNPSFFEITVAMAFNYFSDHKVDIAVVEVGLGGRLDSTNVISPEVSVITNISWDHMNILGDTLEKIAAEKAGIIKNQIPVIVGETTPETKAVFEDIASMNDAPIVFADQVKYVSGWEYAKSYLTVEVADKSKDEHYRYNLDLTGYYQTKNLVTVLEIITCLQRQDWKISQTHVEYALQHVKKLTGLQGRWEIIQHHPMVVLDVGHNAAGIDQVVAQLELSDFNDLHVILGMVKDKDIDAVLQLFPKEATYYFTRASIPRAIDEKELAKKGNSLGLRGEHYPSVNNALSIAKQKASKEDLILVCGSVFVVGEVIF